RLPAEDGCEPAVAGPQLLRCRDLLGEEGGGLLPRGTQGERLAQRGQRLVELPALHQRLAQRGVAGGEPRVAVDGAAEAGRPPAGPGLTRALPSARWATTSRGSSRIAVS